MTNVIDFEQKKQIKPTAAINIVSVHIAQDKDGFYEVEAQINEDFTDHEVFSALLAAAWKYAEDTNLTVSEEELELIYDND